MRLLETTLLTGPYDWDERVLPRSEYDARLAHLRAAMVEAGVAALVIHGHPGNYGAMAWLTGFTPKLGATLALVPREGALRRRLSRSFSATAIRLGPGHSAACRTRFMPASPKRWRRARSSRSIPRSMRCGNANRRARSS